MNIVAKLCGISKQNEPFESNATEGVWMTRPDKRKLLSMLSCCLKLSKKFPARYPAANKSSCGTIT